MKPKFNLPPQPKPERPETELEKKFELRKQYQDKLRILSESGLIELFPSGKMGIYDINNISREIPEYEDILNKIQEKSEIFEKKREQGFTNLIITPFGMPIKDLKNRVVKILFEKQGKTPDSLLYFDDEYNNWNFDIEESIVYYPQNFNKEQHEGKTKKQILESDENTFPGFNIMFIEDLPSLRLPGESKIIGGRKQFEPDMTPIEYLHMIKKIEQYENERGITLEDQMTIFLFYLKKFNIYIDDQDKYNRNCFLLGSYFKDFNTIPLSLWSGLGKFLYYKGKEPNDRFIYHSTRTGVRV